MKIRFYPRIILGTGMAVSLFTSTGGSLPPVFAATSPQIQLISSTKVAVQGTPVQYSVRVSGFREALQYQFWVENPEGQWIGTAYSSLPDFTLSPTQNGSYEVVADILPASQAKQGQFQKALSSQIQTLYVGSSVTTQPLSNTLVKKGGSLTITAQSANILHPVFQFWVETPGGAWQASGAYGTSNQFTVALPHGGTYQVVAYVKASGASDRQSLFAIPVKVQAYGTADALSLTPEQSVLVADNQDHETVQVAVVDKNGVRVPTVNGTADVSLPNASNVIRAIWNGKAWLPSEGISSLPVAIQNGQGTLAIQADRQGISGSLTASFGSWKKTVKIASEPQVATAIQLTTDSTVMLANESGNPGNFHLSVIDQAGYPMLSGTWPLTLTINGPAQFHDLTQGPDELTYQGGNPVPLTIYSIAGLSGPVTLSASGSGLDTVSSTISSVFGGQPSQEAASTAMSSLTTGQSTTVTLTQLTRTQGISDPASLNNDGYALKMTDLNGKPTSGFEIDGTWMNGGTTLTIPIAVGPNEFYAVSQTVQLTDVNASPGTYELQVADPGGYLHAAAVLIIHVN